LDKKSIHKGVELTIQQKPPVVSVVSANLKPNSILEIEYKEAPTNIKWKRSFVFCDDENRVLARADFENSSGSFTIPANKFISQLRRLKNLKLYSEQNPKNEDMMIRSKRVAICTLQLL
jgi:hypothetical protein